MTVNEQSKWPQVELKVKTLVSSLVLIPNELLAFTAFNYAWMDQAEMLVPNTILESDPVPDLVINNPE